MEVLVASPVSWRNMNVPVAAMRSGAVGLLDLTFVKCPLTAANAARELTAAACGPYGLILHGRVGDVEEAALAAMGLADIAPTMAGVGNGRARIGQSCRRTSRRLGAVATCVDDALLAKHLGFDLIVAKGNESGGIVGDETTFILLQRLLRGVDLPIIAWGGGWP